MLEDIGKYLQENKIGIMGKDIFLSRMPDKPIECITLYEYQGQPPDQMAGVETPGLQVCVRTEKYAQGNKKLKNIHDILKEVGYEEGHLAQGVVINGSFYFRIVPVLSGVIPLGVDEKGQLRIARNYYVIKEDK